MNARAKVLLVDQSAEDLAVFSHHLLTCPERRLTVTTATSGEGALEMCATFVPDCIVIGFPADRSEDALELVARVSDRAIFPPTVVLSAAANEQLAVEFMKCGADDYLTKSEASSERFCASVLKALAGNELRRAREARRDRDDGSAERLRVAVERASFLFRATARLAATLDYAEMRDLVSTLPVPFLGDVCIIDLLEQSVLYRRALVIADGDLRDRLGVSPEGIAPDIDAHVGVSAVLRGGDAAYYSGDALGPVARFDADVADLRRAGMRALAVVPLRYDDRIIGTISLGSSDPDAYGAGNSAVVEEYALRAGVALANARTVEAERVAREQAETARRRLSFVSRVSMLFARSLDWEMTMSRLVKIVVPLFSDTAEVYLVNRTDGDGQIERVASEVAHAAVGEILEEIVRRWRPARTDPAGPGHVIEHGRSEYFATFRRDRMTPRDDAHRTLLMRWAPSSSIVVPLTVKGEAVGAVAFTRDSTRPPFSIDDLSLAEDLARRTAAYLENARLYEHQRSIAAALQHSLLPGRLPAIPGLSFAARYIAGAAEMEVGGDWYDVIATGDRRVVITIGDVVGRGVLAAAAMGQFRSLLRAYAFEGFDPAHTLTRLNALQTSMGGDRFATIICLVLDPLTGEMRFASGGHPPMLRRGADGSVDFLESPRSLPIGAWPDVTFAEYTVTLEPGATLLLYTDGLVEARDRGIGEGLDVLAATVGMIDADLDDLVDHVLERVAPDRSDDTAILAIRYDGISDPYRRNWRCADLDAAAAGALRREFASYIDLHADETSDVFGAQLIFGELLGNVVRYAQGALAVEVDWTGSEAVLHVRDHGPGFAVPSAPQLPDDALAMSGRGLYLVNRLARSVTFSRPRDGGSETRVVLPVRRRVFAAPIDDVLANVSVTGPPLVR